MSESELEAFLRAFRDDWIKAGQPGPSLTIAMVKEIERLLDAGEIGHDECRELYRIYHIDPREVGYDG